MTKLLDIQPDRIRKTDDGDYQVHFAGGKNPYTLPVGSEYMVVYSPNGYKRWEVVTYQVVPKRGWPGTIEVVNQRDLTVEEIEHFSEMIAGQ